MNSDVKAVSHLVNFELDEQTKFSEAAVAINAINGAIADAYFDERGKSGVAGVSDIAHSGIVALRSDLENALNKNSMDDKLRGTAGVFVSKTLLEILYQSLADLSENTENGMMRSADPNILNSNANRIISSHVACSMIEIIRDHVGPLDLKDKKLKTKVGF